jgi:glutamyl-tRNA reductase
VSTVSEIEFHLLGLSHRTASIDVRERFAIQSTDLEPCLVDLIKAEEVLEAYALSTCNRTEILVAARPLADPSAIIQRRVFRNAEPSALYQYRGVHAVMHIFRVAGGLDSVVLGETEILGQLKRCADTADSVNGSGSHVGSLISHAIKVGKRLRKETDIGQGTLSVARVGVDLGQHVFGGFENVKALIVGTGETGLLVARHLKDLGVGSLTFLNRTFSRAEDAARELGGRARPLDDLMPAISDTNMIIACVEGTTHLIGAEHFDRKVLSRRDRPLLVIDLSVPRAVDDAVRSIDNVLLYDLDHLQPVVAKNLKGRHEAAAESSSILVAEVHKFLSLRTFADFTPAITELRVRFEQGREEALDKIAGEHANAREIELAHEVTRRLMDVALAQMKDSARRTRSQEALDWEYQRFLDTQ